MRLFKSIRWQLQLWHGLLLLVVICAFGITAYQLERTERLHAIDAELQDGLSLVVKSLRGGQRANPPPPEAMPPQFDDRQRAKLTSSPEMNARFGPEGRFYYVIWMRDAKPVATSANAPADIPLPKERDNAVRIRQPDLREAFIFAAPVDCVLVGRSIASIVLALIVMVLLFGR